MVSVNVGETRLVDWRGGSIRTGIFKQPVRGPVSVGRRNLAGDHQADRVHHGGTLKAVYAYPREHYRFWRTQLGRLPDEWGVFGENLTLAGLLEHELCVGDVLAVGSALLRVTEPRYPCFKLGIRLADDGVVDRFLHANRPGFYLAVEQEGDVRAGDTAAVVSPHPGRLTIAELMRLRVLSGPEDAEALRAAMAVDGLTEEWREHLERRLEALASPRGAPGWPGGRRFRVVGRNSEATDVVSFTLEPVDAGPLAGYRPGQFVAIERPMADARPLVRCYSLCDAPGSDSLRIAVKRLEPSAGAGGMSAWLHGETQVGSELMLRAPAGGFGADPRPARPLVLVAGGIGVTPIHAIATAVAGGQLDRDAYVFFAARRGGEDPFARSLESLAAACHRLAVQVIYSREPPSSDSLSGRITADLVLRTVGATDIDVLICGPERMVRELPPALRQAGVPADRIGVEAFGPAALHAIAPAIVAPPGGHAVTFTRSGLTSRWRSTEHTVLDLAEISGISLPFSCRSGSCGRCAVAVRSGRVAYLSPPAAPVAEDECLACIALPQTALELEI